MDGCSLKYSCEEIVPEALDLHVFITDQSEIDKHVQTDKQLNNASGMFVFIYKQNESEK